MPLPDFKTSFYSLTCLDASEAAYLSEAPAFLSSPAAYLRQVISKLRSSCPCLSFTSGRRQLTLALLRFTGDLNVNSPGQEGPPQCPRPSLQPPAVCPHLGKTGRIRGCCYTVFSEASPIPQGNREPPAREQKPSPVSKFSVPRYSRQLPTRPLFSPSTILLFCFYLLKQQSCALCTAAAFCC